MRKQLMGGISAAVAGVVICAGGISEAGASQAVTQQAEQVPLSRGAQMWVARYNGLADGYTEAVSVAVSPGGGTVFVTGASLVSTVTGYNYATVAYNAATGAQLWSQRYAGPGNSDSGARAVAVSPDGETVFVTGESQGTTSGNDYATVAYNAATGAQLWVKRYNGPGNGYDQATSVAVSPGGGTVYVTGGSRGSSSGSDYATVAYNATTGARLWVERYNGPGNGDDKASKMAVSPGGGTVFVTGSSAGTTSGTDYATVAYKAATGAQLWAKRYNGPGNRNDEAAAMSASAGGGTVFVTGSSAGTTSGTDYATVAYKAATGAQLWAKRYNGPGDSLDQASSVAVSPDGGMVFVTGTSAGTTPGGDYATIAYKAATGALQWASRYNGPGNEDDQATAVAISPGGGTAYVTGSGYVATTNYDYVTVAYNTATGARLWTGDYDGPGNGNDAAFAAAVSPTSGTVFVTGGSQGTTAGADYGTVAYNG